MSSSDGFCLETHSSVEMLDTEKYLFHVSFMFLVPTTNWVYGKCIFQLLLV